MFYPCIGGVHCPCRYVEAVWLLQL